MVTPQLGNHYYPGNHGSHHVPSNQKGRLLPLQPVHGTPAIAVVASSLSTLHETMESSSNGSLSIINTPETLTEKVPKGTASENDKFSDDSLEGGGVAKDHLHPPRPHNVVFNHAFREGKLHSLVFIHHNHLQGDCCYSNCCVKMMSNFVPLVHVVLVTVVKVRVTQIMMTLLVIQTMNLCHMR